jgi:hypothetical protein
MLIPCPVCSRQVSAQAIACPECRTPIATTPAAPGNQPPVAGAMPAAAPAFNAAPPTTTVHVYTNPAGGAEGYGSAGSNVQPVWQYYLLVFCSFGIYDLFWFYSTWRLLKERHRLYITPAARALFREFFAINLSREIFKLSTEAGHKPRWSPVGIGVSYVLLDILAGGCMRQDAPAPFLMGVLFFLASIGVRVPLVNALNDFWRHEQPGVSERTRLSGKAWAVVIIGSIFWIFALLGLTVPKQ